MKAFLAILKLTWRSAFRSHVFQFLLAILIFGTLVIPNTIKGDGSAYSFIQVSLEYSLSFITIMLMLSGVWLSSQIMTQDVEDARIHLLAVKPVSRYTIWFGKFSGVMAVLTLLLILSTLTVYGFITWKYKAVTDDGSQKPKLQNVYERDRISNEILTGRRVYWPVQPEVDKIVKAAFAKQMSELDSSGRKKLDTLTGEQRAAALVELRRQIIASLGEVAPGMTKAWIYNKLPKDVKGKIFLRYKVQSGLIPSSETRKLVFGAWGANVYYMIPPDKAAGKNAKPVMKVAFMTRKPEQIPSNMTNEIDWPAEQIIHDGSAVFGFSNFQKEGSLYFQQADGPKLLIRAATFTENYIRAVLMLFLGIMAITMISIAAGSFLSLPTAVFFSLSYLLFGVISLYIRGTVSTMYGVSMEQVGIEYFGYLFSNIVLSAVIPFQKFGVADYVANGELIDFSMLGSTLLFQVLLKGGPIALLGMWLYNRRELALASIKR